MNISRFIEQIAQDQYEPFREYLKIGDNGRPVTELYLTHTFLQSPNKGVILEKLFEALKPITTLTALSLYGNNIGDESESVNAIAHAIKTNATPTTLGLGCNNIGHHGAKIIADALKTNTTLTTLDLFCNNIGPKGAAAIADALKANTTLTTLKLYDNNISNKGAVAIAKALIKNTNLFALDLGHNRIDNNAAAAIAEALKTNVTLNTLELNENDLTEEALKAILIKIPLESALTNIYLYFHITHSRPQTSINDTIGTLKNEKDVLDAVYNVLPQPITEAFAQYFTPIQDETSQNLLIDPNNDISRGVEYVVRRRQTRKPVSNDSSINTQVDVESFIPVKRSKN